MQIAVIGAGATGLTAARRLSEHGHSVTVYEKSRGVGGRAATRRTNGCVIDHGAQYLKLPAESPQVRALVLEELSREGLFDIGRPVWTFDRAGLVAPGDREQNDEPKWSYVDGITTLSKRLAAGLELHYETRIASLTRLAQGYALYDGAGALLGEAERVLVALPSTQAVELVEASVISSARRAAVLAELGRARYRPILSIVLGYPAPPRTAIFAGGSAADPRPYYALVNTDRGHAVSWLAVENDKGPARVPDGMLVLVAQMGGPFSTAHYDDSAESLAGQAAEAVSTLLALDLRTPTWHDLARWRYALPDTTCSLKEVNRAPEGLYVAGDYVAGGRLHLALQAGLDAAALIEG